MEVLAHCEGGTLTMTSIAYATVSLSEPNLSPIDHDPVCNQTDLHGGGVGLQGSPRSKKQWTVTCLADSHDEIDALDALKGTLQTLNINGVLYHGVMICKPFIETQVTPSTWSYTIGFIQRT